MNEENKTPEILVRLAISGCEDANIVASIAVSYTHLTLPTIA